MAEIHKLSVGQALEKLRGTDAPTTKMARLDEKIDTLDEETRRLRAMRHRIERDQRADSTGRDRSSGERRARRKAKNIMDHNRDSDLDDPHLGMEVETFVVNRISKKPCRLRLLKRKGDTF